MTHKLTRLLALMLAVIMAFSMLLVPVQAASFTDVKDGAWYEAAVEYVTERGWMAGVSASSFAPNTDVTRGMMVTVLARLVGGETDNDAAIFADTTAGKWYTGPASWAAMNGIVAGVGESKFAPNRAITRQDLCLMLYKYIMAMGIELEDTIDRTFSDMDTVSEYARDAVIYCTGTGLIAGFEDSTFRPKSTATRAQLAQILMRLDLLAKGQEIEFMPAQSFDGEAGTDLSVSVSAPVGALPEDTDMTVSRVTDEAYLAALAKQAGVNVVAAADITFTKDGAELEPEKNVEVQFSLDGMEELDNPTVLHVRQDGVLEYVSSEMISTTRGGAKALRFYAKDFSVYIIGSGSTVELFNVTFYESDGEGGWQIINKQAIRKDQVGEGKPLGNTPVYDPGVPSITETQAFEGWAESSTITDETVGKTVSNINAYVMENYTTLDQNEHSLSYYAIVRDVVFITYHDQGGVVIRLESTSAGEYTVDMSYSPFKAGWAHLGWTETINNTGERPTYPENVLYYEKGDTINLTRSIDLYPYLKEGYWISFDNYISQDDDPTSASFTSPIYFGVDEPTVKPTDYGDANNDGVDHDTAPYRVGYTFDDWYTVTKDSEGNITGWGPKYVWGQTLSEDTTVYAKWTPAEAHYQVVYWTQKRTDDAGLAQSAKTWDYYVPTAGGVVTSGTAATGSTVTLTSAASGKTAYNRLGRNAETYANRAQNGELGYFFTLNTALTQISAVVKGDGTTVLNVYYDRAPITISFYSSSTFTSSNLISSSTGLYQHDYNGYPSLSSSYWWVYDDPNANQQYILSDGTRPNVYDNWIDCSETWNIYYKSQTNYSYHIDCNFRLEGTDGKYELHSTNSLGYTNSSNTINQTIGGYEFFGFKGIAYNLYANDTTSTDYTPFTATHAAEGAFKFSAYSIRNGSGANIYYERNKWNFVYQSNGEAVKTETGVYYDANISSFANYKPTNGPAGCYFDGWYSDPGFTTLFDFSKNMPNNDVAVFAKWTMMRFRVVLDYTGGDNSAVVEFPANQASTFRVDYGEKVRDTAIIAATREGYTLLGWYLDPEGNHPFNFGEAITDQTYNMDKTYVYGTGRTGTDAVTGDTYDDDAVDSQTGLPKYKNVVGKLTIYALWRKNPVGSDGVRVRYDAIEGEGYFAPVSDPKVIIRDDPNIYTDKAKAFAQPASTPEDEENYQFLYWVVMKPVKDSNGNVIFDENGEPELEGTTIKVYPGQTFTVDYDYTVQTEAVKVKWMYMDPDGDEWLQDTTTVTKGAEPHHSKPSGYVSASNYYPVIGWKTDDQHIYYYSEDDHSGTDITLPALNENTTFTAVYGPGEAVALHQFTITWQNWDGTVLATQIYNAGQTPSYPNATPTRPQDDDYAYTFNAWTPAITVVNGDATYTATYTAVDRVYTITFDANSATGGTFTDGTTTTATATKGTLFRDIFPDDPTNSDTARYFLGWFTAANGGTEVVGTDEFDGTVTTLYAHWYTASWDRDTSGTIIDGDYYCFCTYSNSTYYWVTNAGNNSYLTRTSSTNSIPTGAMWYAEPYTSNTSYHYLWNTLNDSDYQLMETQSSPYPAVAVNDDATISTYYTRVQLVEGSNSGMYYLKNSYSEYLYYSTSYTNYNYIWSESYGTQFLVYHFVYQDLNAGSKAMAADGHNGEAADRLTADNLPALNREQPAFIAGFDKPEASAAPAATRGNTNPVRATTDKYEQITVGTTGLSAGKYLLTYTNSENKVCVVTPPEMYNNGNQYVACSNSGNDPTASGSYYTFSKDMSSYLFTITGDVSSWKNENGTYLATGSSATYTTYSATPETWTWNGYRLTNSNNYSLDCYSLNLRLASSSSDTYTLYKLVEDGGEEPTSDVTYELTTTIQPGKTYLIVHGTADTAAASTMYVMSSAAASTGYLAIGTPTFEDSTHQVITNVSGTLANYEWTVGEGAYDNTYTFVNNGKYLNETSASDGYLFANSTGTYKDWYVTGLTSDNADLDCFAIHNYYWHTQNTSRYYYVHYSTSGFYNYWYSSPSTADIIYLYEKVEGTKYPITFNFKDSEGGNQSVIKQTSENEMPEVPSVPETYKLNGTTWHFTGWDKQVVAATEAAAYTAQYEVQSYDITWIYKNANGEDTSVTRTVAPGVVPTPGFTPSTYTQNGDEYRFQGWSTTAGGTVADPVAATGPATYYAVYTNAAHTITWHTKANGGAWTTTETRVAEGTVPSYNSHPIWKDSNDDEWMFSGWAASENGEVIDPLPAVTEDAHYYAKYTKVGVYTYTMYLYAVYGRSNKSGLTHIFWYANNGTADNNGGGVRQEDNGLEINAPTDIPTPENFSYVVAARDGETTQTLTGLTYVGHTFLGWARIRNTDDNDGMAHPEFNSVDDCWLVWHEDTGTYTVNNDNKEEGEADITGTVDQVRGDEFRPYHDLYAVWESHVFYVYHSSSGVLQAFDMPLNTAATATPGAMIGDFDITALVSDGYLYGGYYKTYGGVNMTELQKVADTVGYSTWNEGTLVSSDWTQVGEIATDTNTKVNFEQYTGASLTSEDNDGAYFWTRDDAYNADNLPTGFTAENINGETMKPMADAIYYLKEVPANKYLHSYYTYVLRFNTDGSHNEADAVQVDELYLFTVVDDNNYKTNGVRVDADYTAAEGAAISRTALAPKFSLTQSGNANNPSVTRTFTPNNLIQQRGYLSIYHPTLPSGTVTMIPSWKTLDGVTIGNAPLDVTVGEKTVTNSATTIPTTTNTKILYVNVAWHTWWFNDTPETRANFHGEGDNWVQKVMTQIGDTTYFYCEIPDNVSTVAIQRFVNGNWASQGETVTLSDKENCIAQFGDNKDDTDKYVVWKTYIP